MKQDILQIHQDDNVATALRNIRSGEEIRYSTEGKRQTIVASEKIPFGHKISLSDIPEGMEVRKYGEIIGRTNMFIQRGQHVHVHNVESLRGRGDLEDIEK